MALKIGDKVRHRYSYPGTFGYDEGIIVGITPRQQRARVSWRRARQSYDEMLGDLEQVPTSRRSG